MDYKELAGYRQRLLDLYDSLESSCEDFTESGYEIDSELRAMQENVEAERFLLAIFGEVKAGKSTFINALLKEAILPSDDLQATSEIIEVHKSVKKKAEITFVNGRNQVIENEVVRSLKDIASVNEEYRSIPIVQINRFLSEHYSEEKGEAVYNDDELKTFLSSDLENTHNLNEEEFKSKICNYIDQSISCEKIPSWVSLYYPHDVSDFTHFRIVDTPGVNAIGGIEERTKGFINQADAVICLCNAGQLESRTLGNILENDLPKDVKKHLILVLTHRSDYPSNEQRNRILDHANNILTVGSDNIFFLDSLTELDLQKFYGAKTIDKIDAIRATDQELRGRTAHFYEEVSGNRNEFLNLLRDQANFRGIRERIKKDAGSSAATQMKKFANAMQREYEELKKRIEARIAPLKMEYKDPQYFASKIQNQEDEKVRMKRDYNGFKDTLRTQFSPCDENSRYSQKINQMMENFFDDITQKEFAPNDHNYEKEDRVRDYVANLNQSWIDKISGFVNTLKVEYQKEVTDRDVELQSDYSITVPEIDLGSIWEAAFNSTESQMNEKLVQVYRERSVMRRVWDTLTKDSGATENKRNEIKRSFPIQFWNEIRPGLEELYEEAKTKLSDQVATMINNVCEEDKRKLDEEIQERNQRIEKLEEDKRKNEKLGKKISSLKEKREKIKAKVSKCRMVGSQL